MGEKLSLSKAEVTNALAPRDLVHSADMRFGGLGLPRPRGVPPGAAGTARRGPLLRRLHNERGSSIDPLGIRSAPAKCRLSEVKRAERRRGVTDEFDPKLP